MRLLPLSAFTAGYRVHFTSLSLRNAVETRRKGIQRAEKKKREIWIGKHRGKF